MSEGGYFLEQSAALDTREFFQCNVITKNTIVRSRVSFDRLRRRSGGLSAPLLHKTCIHTLQGAMKGLLAEGSVA